MVREQRNVETSGVSKKGKQMLFLFSLFFLKKLYLFIKRECAQLFTLIAQYILSHVHAQGTCRDVLEDYRIMQSAIDATGRGIVLSVEGNPDVAIVSRGGHGNLRRVGHDITASWTSMTSLIDFGSGLYSYAHNDSGTGGWWNDLDMLEIGNGDFNADSSAGQLQMARAHMGMWCIMKAPLLLGNDLSKMGPLTLATIVNRAALSINQDSWGVQAHRVASVPSPDTRILPRYTGQVILAKCNGSPMQTWKLRGSQSKAVNLYMVKCNASDPFQQWSSVVSTPGPLKNAGNGQCVDDSAGQDPAQTAICKQGAILGFVETDRR